MPRIYMRNDRIALKKTFDAWKNGQSIRMAAGSSSAATMTLMDAIRCSRITNGEIIETSFKNRMVLTQEMKKLLADCLRNISKMFYGLTPTQTKSFAFQYAKANNVKYPSTWDKNEQAGRDWFTGFMERNNDLSLRIPEQTSFCKNDSF